MSGAGLAGATLLGVAGCGGAGSGGQGGGNGGEARTFSYAYDQPKESGYGIAARIFSDKLEELSSGALVIEQFPGGQLGEEPETLDSIRNGDIDFISVATANVATIAAQSGVFSLHFLFDGPEHAIRTLADPDVNQAYQNMIEDSTDGTRMLTLLTQGLRDVYSGFQVQSVNDMVDKSIRIQATSTEQTLWSAYGAQTVNMPFGEVYTSLQTGVVDAAENSANNYLVNKHYEVAPIYSKTQHEANNAALFVSDQVWESLSDEEKGWVEGAAEEVRNAQPPEAFDLDAQAEQELRDLGVEIFEDVDRQSFIEIAEPVVDQLAEDLGQYAEEIVSLVRDLRA
ncbi:MAG: TRAP transporter substrate-binding protein [Rubrobacteraceae bacterium]